MEKQITSAASQYESGKKELEESRKQLDTYKSELEKGRKAAGQRRAGAGRGPHQLADGEKANLRKRVPMPGRK